VLELSPHLEGFLESVEIDGPFDQPALGETSPSIEQRFNAATAPGLENQPAFMQFAQGIRVRPFAVLNALAVGSLVRTQENRLNRRES
jgi:hypothetical protein